MFGIGPTELVAFLFFALSSGGLLGLPLSTPPLPPDPVIERTAPDVCLVHVETAGVAAAVEQSDNLTERMLADPEMREFLADVSAALMGLARQSAAAPPELTDAAATIVGAALTRPLAVTIERFEPPREGRPPLISATLMLRTGDRQARLERAVASVVRQLFSDAAAGFAPETIRVAGGAWQRLETPAGPLSWGFNDGSFVLTIGPKALESLLARTGDEVRTAPDWKRQLEKRLPVARRSTLAYVDVAAVMRIVADDVPDRGRFQAVLDASGFAGLETVGAVSGMTDEGVASSLWLGFDGRPTGLFAPPATGIGPAVVSRVPADATLVQSWSLDPAELLALAIDFAATVEPQAVESIREGLEQVRAVAGFDIVTDLLEPLGTDWTVFMSPSPGGLLPNVAVVAGVRDRTAFARTHRALLRVVQNAAVGGDAQIDIREVSYRGQTLFCLTASGGDGMALPLTPTWCLAEDRLMFTLSPQFMKTLLARTADSGSLADVPEVKEALAAGDPAVLGVIDPAALLGSLCGLYEMAVPVAQAQLRDRGLDVELPQLPRASAIMPFARPGVSIVRHEPEGIVFTSTSTVPLGPLSAGGGLVGVSPASTPVLIGLLLPAVQSAREAARRSQAMNNFKQVLLAMHVHADARRRFPSQAICDAEGRPLLSWRVALLPFIEENELYEQFRLDEPWDSEHNRKLIALMPMVYADPADTPERIREGLTTLQVFTGPNTAFTESGRAVRMEDIRDGLSKTIAIVEALPEQAVPWTKPDDLAFDSGRPLDGVGNPRRPGGLFAVGFFDGYVEMLSPQEIDAETFKALVTPGGGEVIRR